MASNPAFVCIRAAVSRIFLYLADFSPLIDQRTALECRETMNHSIVASPEIRRSLLPGVSEYPGLIRGGSDVAQISRSTYTFVRAWCEAHARREKPVSKSPFHKILPWEKEFFCNIEDAAIIEIAGAAVVVEIQSLVAACRQITTLRGLRSEGSRRVRKGKGLRNLRVTTLEKVSRMRTNQER